MITGDGNFDGNNVNFIKTHAWDTTNNRNKSRKLLKVTHVNLKKYRIIMLPKCTSRIFCYSINISMSSTIYGY